MVWLKLWHGGMKAGRIYPGKFKEPIRFGGLPRKERY